MRSITKKKLNSESGAALIVEMTLIFPFVLFIMGFLLYMGNYVLDCTMLYNNAQKIAVIAAREAAIPGYEELYRGSSGNIVISSQADFNWPSRVGGSRAAMDGEIIKKIMKNHDPYRYIGNNFLSTSDKDTLDSCLESLVTKGSFLSSSNVDCQITTSNYVLTQQVHVRVTKKASVPGFVRYLGVDKYLDIEVTATAVVSDPAEFVRNTDAVFDIVDYLFNEVTIGNTGKTASQYVDMFKQKFTDICGSLGWGGL